MAKKKNSLKILIYCLLLAGAVAATNYFWAEASNGDQLPSEVNTEHPVASSAERNAAFAEQEASEVQRAQNERSSEEAPEEGLSQTPYENLEQPATVKYRSEAILFKSQFIISYNVEKLCPNYVCWSLTSDRVNGSVKRSNNFSADPTQSETWRVIPQDYARSGYDRGHMCPAGDNKNSKQGMDESFYMSNICPQNGSLNSGAWNELESLCRDWAKDYGTVYICCGPIFDSTSPQTIGNRSNVRIAVPDRFFKVVLMLGRVPRAIGFIYPNRSCKGDIRDYAVSVDKVEEETGLDFFYQLEDSQERELEKVCNPGAWGI